MSSGYKFETRSQLVDATDRWRYDDWFVEFTLPLVGTDVDYTYAREIYGDINTWDVSAITDFSGVFANHIIFDSDISNWDVSNGIRFDYMFHNASLFNQDISSWDVTNIERLGLGAMFYNASSFNQDISSWDVSNNKDFTFMFRGATSFNQDISSWNVGEKSNFTDMLNV